MLFSYTVTSQTGQEYLGLKHIMATGIARIIHNPTSVLRHHFADLHKVISQSRETRISLANRFFQTRLIDFHVLSSITDSDGISGAQTLLGHLSMKVEQSSDYLPGVIGILRREVSLIDIVERMNVFRRNVSLSPTDVTITSKKCYLLLHVIGGGNSLSNRLQCTLEFLHYSASRTCTTNFNTRANVDQKNYLEIIILISGKKSACRL